MGCDWMPIALRAERKPLHMLHFRNDPVTGSGPEELCSNRYSGIGQQQSIGFLLGAGKQFFTFITAAIVVTGQHVTHVTFTQ